MIQRNLRRDAFAHLARALDEAEPLVLANGRDRRTERERMRFVGVAVREKVVVEVGLVVFALGGAGGWFLRAADCEYTGCDL